jgi:hypothetical protein
MLHKRIKHEGVNATSDLLESCMGEIYDSASFEDS